MFTFERQLEELSQFDGHGANVLSVYLPTDPLARSIADAVAQFLLMRDALRCGLEPLEQQALDADSDAVIDYLHSMIAPPAAIALFVCSSREFFRIVRLPVALDAVVFWAPTPNLAPLYGAENVQPLHALPL